MLNDVLSQKGLSNREIEVAQLVVKGLSNQEIADRLCVTPKTVKFHLTSIYKKVSLKSRAQFIVWCVPHLTFEGAAANKPISDLGSMNQNVNSEPADEKQEESPFLYSGNAIVGDN